MDINSGSPIKIAIQELIDSLDDINFKVLSSGIGLEEDRRVKRITVKDVRFLSNSSIKEELDDSNTEEGKDVDEYNSNLYSKTSKHIVNSLDKDASFYKIKYPQQNQGSFFNRILFKKKSSVINNDVLEKRSNEKDLDYSEEKNQDNDNDTSLVKKFSNIKKPFNYLASNDSISIDSSSLDGSDNEDKYNNLEQSKVVNNSSNVNDSINVSDNSSRSFNINKAPSYIRTQVSNRIPIGIRKTESTKRKANFFIRVLAHGIDIGVILVTLFISSILISKVLFPNMKNLITDNPLFRFILNMNIIEFVVIVYLLFIVYKYLFKTLIGSTIGQFCFGIKSK